MAASFPDIYYFNPTCEYAVANGRIWWQPNRLLQKMEADLGTLPVFFARPEDVVLVHKTPSSGFIESLKKVGIDVPEFVLLDDAVNDRNFLGRPKNRLMPWGWSPHVHRVLAPFKPSCSEVFFRSPVFKWQPEHRELYSKKFALGILNQLLVQHPAEYYIPKQLTGEICSTVKDIEPLLNRWGKIMVKAPWSSSGRGLQPVTKKPVHPKVWEKLQGMINEQGYVIVEPFLDKKFDMAFQFEMASGNIQYLGISNFIADKKGQYQGNYLNGLTENADPVLTIFAEKCKTGLVNPLIDILKKSKLARLYEGTFGVDTLIYADENQELRINPCLEINVRQNMGLLSLKLNHLLYPGAKGKFTVFYSPGKTFRQFSSDMGKKHPLSLSGQKIKSGYFPLTDIEGTQFGAYLLV